jgi:hypothetical protein
MEVCGRIHTVFPNHFSIEIQQVLKDPEFSKLYMQQETSRIYPGVCTFSTDTLLQFDFSEQNSSSKPVLAVGIFKLPDHMSTEKFYESVRAHTIAFAELPAVQKYQLVNYILVGWTVMLHKVDALTCMHIALQCSGLLTTESGNASRRWAVLLPRLRLSRSLGHR